MPTQTNSVFEKKEYFFFHKRECTPILGQFVQDG